MLGVNVVQTHSLHGAAGRYSTWDKPSIRIAISCYFDVFVRKGVAPLGPKVTSTRLILIFRGLCGVGFMATYYYSLAVLPMSDAVVLTYTSPVLTALAATVFLGETWHSLDFLGSALCLTGEPGFHLGTWDLGNIL